MANLIKSLKAPKTKALDKKPAAGSEKVISKQGQEGDSDDTRRRVILLTVKIVFFVAICYIVFFVVFGVARMGDYSMYPSIKDGDLLVYYRMENNFNNGDIVVVDRGDGEEVYRIVALPGQSVEISEDNGLTVDGQPSTYEAFYETHKAEDIPFKFPFRVPSGCYFMLNDYRSNTNDSRAVGAICQDKIKGRLITKIQVRDF